MNKNELQHNGIISFWKFAFAMMICILHAYVFATSNEKVIFDGGSIGVEFFFVVSGYLLGVSIYKKNNEDNIVSDTWKFIFNKIKKLFPYILISFIFIATLDILTKERTIFSLAKSIWDLFFLRMSGVSTNRINAVAWYISAMLLAMLVIYPLGRKYKKTYTCLICPLIVIFLGGFMSYTYGNLRTPMSWTGLCYKGLLRAFLELNVGIICYEMVLKIKDIKFTKLFRMFLTIVEVFCFSSIFIIAQFVQKTTRFDYLMLLAIAIGVIIAFSKHSLTYDFCCNKFFYYLERLSLPLYLIQMFGIYLIQRLSIFNNFNYYQKLIIYLVIILILANLIMLIVESFFKNSKKIFAKVRPLVIED